MSDSRSRWWSEPLIIVLLTVLALVPRVYRLPEVPPGLYGDEAANGADILTLVDHGQYPILFERNTGREPLFIYLQALTLALLGATPLALRLTAALAGTATVPAVYWMVREAFRGMRRAGRWAALWTALFLAFSYWHINFSRMGLRVIMLPLAAALAFAWFWRAWPAVVAGRAGPAARRWPWLDLVLCGACIGAGLYTYLAARMLPLLVLAVAVAGVLLPGRSWSRLKRVAAALGIVAGAATLVFLPLGLYYLGHPGSFMGHSASVSFLADPTRSPAAPLLALADNVVRTARMYGLAADYIWRQNPAQRPAFDPILSAWLAAGVVLALANWRSLPHLFAVLWLAVFSLPAVLSDSPPNFLRGLGMLPAACLLAALALLAAGRWLARRAPPGWPAAPALATWLPLPFVLLSGLTGLQAYFGAFAHAATDPNALAAFDVRIMQIAPFVAQNDGPDRAWVLPLLPISGLPDRRDYTDNFNFLTGATPRLRAVATPEELTDLARGRRYANLITWRYTALEAGASYAHVDGKGKLAFLLNKYGRDLGTRGDAYATYATFELPKDPDFRVAEEIAPQDVAFAGKLRLTGLAYGHTATGRDEPPAALEQKRVPSGQDAWAVLRWQAQEAVPNTLKASLYLTDAAGHVAGQADDFVLSDRYLWEKDWRPGESGLTYHILPTLPGVPPGRYDLNLAVYDSATGERWPVTQAHGTPGGTAARLGAIEVTSAITAPQIAPGVLLPAPAALAPGLELLGYDPAPAAHDPGTTLPLTLYWRAARPLAADYQVRLVLRDAGGQVVARQTRPAAGSYGAAQWRPGEIVRGWQDLALPAALPQGDYRLEVAVDGPAAAGPAQDLGALRIAGRPHLFSPPAVASPQDLRVSQAFRFVGESLAAPRVQAGRALSLTLHWQGLAPADRSYTVFVHLLGPDGRIWAQQDRVPGDGALATTTWLPGEYVADSYRLAVQPGAPPGTYTLEIGMYDAATGQRLPITDAAGAAQGDRILLPTPVEVIR